MLGTVLCNDTELMNNLHDEMGIHTIKYPEKSAAYMLVFTVFENYNTYIEITEIRNSPLHVSKCNWSNIWISQRITIRFASDVIF